MASQPEPQVICLTGELDVARKDEVRRALAVPAARTPVLLDLSQVTYADSTAIAELLRFRTAMVALGGRLALLSATAQLARVLEYAGLTKIFTLFSDRDEALRYLAEPCPP